MHAYLIAAIVLLALAPFSLAAHLHARWMGRARLSFANTYALLLACITLFAILASVWMPKWGSSSAVLVGPLAVVAALIAAVVELTIVDTLVRHVRRGRQAMVARRDIHPVPLKPQVRTMPVERKAVGGERRRLGFERIHERSSTSLLFSRWNMINVTAVAAFEECLYRGVLLDISIRRYTQPVSVFLICLGALVFALSHIWFGWAQVLAKIP
jgi:hypothetical protein